MVKINAQTPAHGDESGAGIIVGRDEHLVLIVTAQHVVMDAPQVEVVFFDKPYKGFQGRPFRKYHEDLDIAVVIVDMGQENLIPADLSRLSLGDMARLKEGDKVSTIGHPLDQEWQVAIKTNMLAGLSEQEDVRKLRFTRTALERGNSGGPVFNEYGALIGMVTKLQPLYAVAVKIDAVLAVLRDEWRIPTWWRADEAKTVLARELLAQVSATRRQVAAPASGEETASWSYLLAKKGRGELLQRSVLLAVEAMQRAPSPEAEHALRDGLTWLTRPVVFLRHTAYVNAMAVSPDGTLLATASYDKTARLWEFASGREVARLAHQGPVTAVAFSPHGPYLATASEDATARLWEMPGGREVVHLAHTGEVRQVTFSPQGAYIATTSADRTARVWEVPSGREVARLAHTALVRAAVFSPDGAVLVTTNGNTRSQESNIIRVWAVPSGRQSMQMLHTSDQGRWSTGIEALAMSPDGKFLATASADQSARLWDMSTGREAVRLDHASTVEALAFSSDGRYLATGSRNSTIQVWEMSSGKTVQEMHHSDGVVKVAFSPDGQYLASAGRSDIALVWAVHGGREMARVTHDGWLIDDIAFSPDGQYLVTQGRDHAVRIWRLWPADLLAEACVRLRRNLTPEEWHQSFGDAPYHKTCPHLP